MSGNTLGKLFTVTTFGESHGPAIGGIVDGCPPGMDLTEVDLQVDLDRRRPGKSRHRHNVGRPMKLKFFRGFLKEKQRVLPLAY